MVEESTWAALADILTHQFREKKEKKESKHLSPLLPPLLKEIEQAFSLYFDGANKRKYGRVAARIVLFNPLKEKVMERGMVLLNVSSNNEAKHVSLIARLEWCVSNKVEWPNVYGISMLVVKQNQGIWSCKSDKLATKLQDVKGFLRKIKHCQVHYVGRARIKRQIH